MVATREAETDAVSRQRHCPESAVEVRQRYWEGIFATARPILRASGHEPLPLNDPGVLKDLVKVASGGKLSPVLVVSRDDGAEIADGYHRVSLTYALDPFAAVPVRIASLSPARALGQDASQRG